MKSHLRIAEHSKCRGTALFSADGQYRYTLNRIWNEPVIRPRRAGHVLFIGLNPSTANEAVDDPTVRRMGLFARDWGFSAMTVCNLFAFRATDPRDMKRAVDPIGPKNRRTLQQEAQRAALVVICWGNHGMWLSEAEGALERLQRRLLVQNRGLHCFGLTSLGQPKHPLYLRRDAKPVLMRAPRGLRSATIG